jgi:hypothetical protein
VPSTVTASSCDGEGVCAIAVAAVKTAKEAANQRKERR